MEEQNQPTSPIAGEPATVNDLVLAVSKQYHGLMALRAMLVQACNEAPLENEALLEQALIQVDTLLGLEQPTEDASEGLTHEDGDFIMAQDTMFKRPLVESDFTVTGNSEGDEEMPADYWHGEMRAEAEAERRADAALELAAELASCDWEGWD